MYQPLTVTQVSRLTGVPRSTIYRFLNATAITTSHLDRIARWLYQ
jgi:predicted DNA-binding transcriptional regulator AlpA